MLACTKKHRKIRPWDLQNPPRTLQNRVRGAPRRTKTGQERQQTQQDAQNAVQKRPRAKNSANIAKIVPTRLPREPDLLNSGRVGGPGDPPLKHLKQVFKAVYKAYWSDTPGHAEHAADFLRSAHATDPAIAKVFAEICRKKSISLIVRTSRRVREVESYALSKFQPRTTLGDPQNVEKTIRKKFDFFWSRKSVFCHFWWIFEELDNF